METLRGKKKNNIITFSLHVPMRIKTEHGAGEKIARFTNLDVFTTTLRCTRHYTHVTKFYSNV